MRALRSGALKLARAAIWPLYLVLLAYAARVGPWPRSLGILASALLTAVAMAILAHELLHFLVWPSAWSERRAHPPQSVPRQLDRAGRFLIVAAVVFLLPVYLFDHELIAPEGRPVAAPALGRILVIGYELLVWATCMRLLRKSSALWEWLALPRAALPGSDPFASRPESGSPSQTANSSARASHAGALNRVYAGLVWLGRRRRSVAGLVLVTVASVIVLDVRGYSFTARRLAVGGLQTALAIALAATAYRGIARAISQNVWRWARPNRSWAMALTSAVALRSRARARGALVASTSEAASSTSEASLPDDNAAALDDLATGLRRLTACVLTVFSLFAIAWIWDLDMALARFLLSQVIWAPDGQPPVSLGDMSEAAFIILLGVLAWRYMNTLFAVTIFPRMPDDPGVRFAVVTLCRYAALGVTTLTALGAVHLDLAKIGFVLAALGVGLGFGLQEIVSNFVCGIILLLERPIRIGDVVTVAGNTGKVDRINIRATTILNADNQSMIVPNREFITGNLVNWTLKDKILRVPIKISVAYGTDPERVVKLLLTVAREDVDVMKSPEPSAGLEGFGESALLFGLYTFVPDPGLAGGVRHRLCAEIQRRFAEAGMVIPFPTHVLHVNGVPLDLTQAVQTSPDDHANAAGSLRYDQTSRIPPAPHALSAGANPATGDDLKEAALERPDS
jgi:potassium efflux system protein